MTGSASRAASRTEVTLAGRGPVGSARRRDQDAVGGGDDAEQAHPVGAGKAGFGEPDVQRLGDHRVRVEESADEGVHAAGGDRFAQSANNRRVDRRDQGDHHGARGAVGPPGRHVGQHRPQVGGVAWPAAVNAGVSHFHRRVVHPEDRGQLARRAGGQVGVSAGDGEHERGRGLRQAGGHGPAVPATRPQRVRGRLAHRERLGLAALPFAPRGAGRRGRAGPRAGRSPPPKASKLPVALAFGCRSGRSGENGGADDTPPGCRGGMPSLGCRMGMPAEGSRASVTSRKPNAKGSFVPQKC